MVVGFATLAGCALTNKADAVDVHWFAPAQPERKVDVAQQSGLTMRLGRIRSAAHLESEIVYRESDVKFGSYPFDRWTERPEDYVRRAVSTAIFDERGVVQAVGGSPPVLDLQVLAFEEVRRGDQKLARVTIDYALRNDKVVLLADVITVERPANGTDVDGVVVAMGGALSDASEKLGDAILKKLAEGANNDSGGSSSHLELGAPNGGVNGGRADEKPRSNLGDR
jgi:cholesterol transport system auxiliary component